MKLKKLNNKKVYIKSLQIQQTPQLRQVLKYLKKFTNCA